MTGIDTLIRLHRRHLDDKRIRRAALDEQRDILIAHAAELEGQLETERRAASASFEARHTFAAYVRRMDEKKRTTAAEIATFDGALARADDDIAAAFQELKRYEISRDARIALQRQADARQERHDLDEIGAELHRRAQ